MNQISLKKESPQYKWTYRYLLTIFVFVGLLISDLGPIVANDLLFFLQLIFIILYLGDQQLSSLGASIKENRLLAVLFLLWSASSLVSLLNSSFLGNFNALINQPFRFLGSITHIIFGFCLWHFLVTQNINRWSLFFTMALTASLTGLNFFLIGLSNPQMLASLEFWGNPPFYMNIRQAGFHCSAAIAVTSALTFFGNNTRNKQVALYMLTILLWTYLFWTGGRASAIASIVALVFLTLVIAYKKLPTSKIVLFSIGCILIAAFLSESISASDRHGLINAMNKVVIANDANAATSGRSDIWLISLQSIQDRWLFGLGAEGFEYLYDKKGKTLTGTQPHNVIVQFLVEWGAIGFSLASLFLSLIFLKGFKLFIAQTNQDLIALKAASLMIIVAYSVTALADGTYYHAQPVLYLVTSFCIWLLPEQASDAEK